MKEGELQVEGQCVTKGLHNADWDQPLQHGFSSPTPQSIALILVSFYRRCKFNTPLL